MRQTKWLILQTENQLNPVFIKKLLGATRHCSWCWNTTCIQETLEGTREFQLLGNRTRQLRSGGPLQNQREAWESQESDEQSRSAEQQNDLHLKGSYALDLRGNPSVTRDLQTWCSYKDTQVSCLFHPNTHTKGSPDWQHWARWDRYCHHTWDGWTSEWSCLPEVKLP